MAPKGDVEIDLCVLPQVDQKQKQSASRQLAAVKRPQSWPFPVQWPCREGEQVEAASWAWAPGGIEICGSGNGSSSTSVVHPGTPGSTRGSQIWPMQTCSSCQGLHPTS